MSGADKNGTQSWEDWAGTISAAVGLYSMVQVILRLRRRARHPDMADPARTLMVASKLGSLGLALLLAVAHVLAVAYWGPVAVFALIVIDLLMLVAAAASVLAVLERCDKLRRASGYVICELDYSAAPRQVKSAMRRIYKSSRSIRGERAYLDGMFGDMGLDQLVYSAAERAVLSSELSTAVTDLKPDATAADKAALADANAQIDEIIAYLRDVESALEVGGKSASKLSGQIGEPARQRAAAQQAEAAAEASAVRRESARKRVEDATARAAAKTSVDPADVQDRLHAVTAGYEEAIGVSDSALKGPTLDDEKSAGDKPPNGSRTREVAGKAARATARASMAAAKAGAQRYKDRRDN